MDTTSTETTTTPIRARDIHGAADPREDRPTHSPTGDPLGANGEECACVSCADMMTHEELVHCIAAKHLPALDELYRRAHDPPPPPAPPGDDCDPEEARS